MVIQPVEYVLANGIGFCEGNVIKYVSRWQQKGGVEDLRKARHYLDLLIDHQLRGTARDVEAHTPAHTSGPKSDPENRPEVSSADHRYARFKVALGARLEALQALRAAEKAFAAAEGEERAAREALVGEPTGWSAAARAVSDHWKRVLADRKTDLVDP
jgi:hypothetical protein